MIPAAMADVAVNCGFLPEITYCWFMKETDRLDIKSIRFPLYFHGTAPDYPRFLFWIRRGALAIRPTLNTPTSWHRKIVVRLSHVWLCVDDVPCC
jgi:hypothetical protein